MSYIAFCWISTEHHLSFISQGVKVIESLVRNFFFEYSLATKIFTQGRRELIIQATLDNSDYFDSDIDINSTQPLTLKSYILLLCSAQLSWLRRGTFSLQNLTLARSLDKIRQHATNNLLYKGVLDGQKATDIRNTLILFFDLYC